MVGVGPSEGGTGTSPLRFEESSFNPGSKGPPDVSIRDMSLTDMSIGDILAIQAFRELIKWLARNRSPRMLSRR